MNFNEVIQKVSRTTLAGEIFDQLLDLITRGELPPGEKLPPERELADTFGVARTSLREALRALTMMGLLDARPGEGTFITQLSSKFFLYPAIRPEPITRENLVEWLEARRLIEVELAGLAAERGTKEEKDLIRDCFNKMKNAVNDINLHDEESKHFHESIAEASHNSYLFQVFLMMRQLIQAGSTQSPDTSRFLSSALKEHSDILNSILAGDANAAREAMRYHIEESAKHLLEIIEE